jgi:hypothetical protein
MTASNVAQMEPGLAPRAGRFPPQHSWDRNFFLIWAALAWAGILTGFGPEVVQHVQTHAKPYPLIVHFHAAAFMGWLVLFTVQILLIRTRRLTVHRSLGFAMVGLAGIMMVLGPATALIADHAKIGTPAADPGFLSIQFTDIVAFVGLVSAAVLLRNDASAHKRLILLATLYITDAGFGRFLFKLGITGTDTASMWGSLYLGSTALILGAGVYDMITRKRLHPVYLPALAWVAAMQTVALVPYANPAWKTLAASWIAAA